MYELTDREKFLVKKAFAFGYDFGHDHTVDGCYMEPDDVAADWIEAAEHDGVLFDMASEFDDDVIRHVIGESHAKQQ